MRCALPIPYVHCTYTASALIGGLVWAYCRGRGDCTKLDNTTPLPIYNNHLYTVIKTSNNSSPQQVDETYFCSVRSECEFLRFYMGFRLGLEYYALDNNRCKLVFTSQTCDNTRPQRKLWKIYRSVSFYIWTTKLGRSQFHLHDAMTRSVLPYAPSNLNRIN